MSLWYKTVDHIPPSAQHFLPLDYRSILQSRGGTEFPWTNVNTKLLPRDLV